MGDSSSGLLGRPGVRRRQGGRAGDRIQRRVLGYDERSDVERFRRSDRVGRGSELE